MIRDLDRADLPALTRLFEAASDYVTLETGQTGGAAQAQAVFDEAPPPGVDPAQSLHLGVFDGDRLLGKVDAAFGYPLPADAYIGLMVFDPAARGLGLGARLLREVERRARLRGATRLLVATLEANPRGRAFWRREGFQAEATFPDRDYGLRRHDVLRMVKPL